MMPRESQARRGGEAENGAVGVGEAAAAVGASAASIRNWLRAGYLEPAGRGMVAAHSLERFKTEIAGRSKLRRRANKSRKDGHDHRATTAAYLTKIAECDGACALLGSEYEASLSDSHRNREGVYYTPDDIVDALLTATAPPARGATFCDPCCGSGNFVARALSLGFRPENVYAFDTDPVAVELTKKRISGMSGFRGSNVMLADFLTDGKTRAAGKFDCISTNPPWGKKMALKTRKAIGGRLRAGASLDACSLFFFACLEALTDGGKLGLLLPEAFFTVSSYADARIRALACDIERLIDFGKPFGGLMSRAHALILSKRKGGEEKLIVCESGSAAFGRTAESFRSNPKSIFNLHCSQKDADTIAHIFSIPHITLKNRAKWALGIVTGDNAGFVRDRAAPGLIPVFGGSDIVKGRFAGPRRYIPSDLSRCQQVAAPELYAAGEKLVYKFISSRLSFARDTSRRFVLNSANILIPNGDFPVNMRTLRDLLNGDLMNWIFSTIFNTRKILRSDLECLPIHAQFLRGRRFDEIDLMDRLGVEKKRDGGFQIAARRKTTQKTTPFGEMAHCKKKPII